MFFCLQVDGPFSEGAAGNQGRTEDFVMGGGPRDIVYSGNMGAITPIRTANDAFF